MVVVGLLSFSFSSHHVVAQQHEKVNLRLEARGDFQGESIADEAIDGNSGFKGRFLNLRLDGNITEAWSYSYRQRMNKPASDASYFDAVDWVHFTYTTGRWAFSGGKQVVAVGGYEYDCAPIDFFFGSEYWNNMACYQFGVSARYDFGTESGDALKFQITQSPFRTPTTALFGYNLLWTGSYGWIDVIHSVNMMEYQPGRFVNFIALGHQFHMGNMSLRLDWMNRADMAHFAFDKDFLLVADLSWNMKDKFKWFGKVSYEINEDNVADYCVLPGTQLTRVGGGVEYYPIEGSRDVRIHGVYSYTWGRNTKSASQGGTLFGDQSFLSLGVTWKMNILQR